MLILLMEELHFVQLRRAHVSLADDRKSLGNHRG